MDPMELTNYSRRSMATFIQRDSVACRIAKVRENGDSDVASSVPLASFRSSSASMSIAGN
jgi:hypothetical protein